VVARIGGDEFVIALFDVARRELAAIVAQKLLAALEAPFPISGHDLRISASVGIAVYPEDASDTLSLLRFADFAMNRAKQEGDDGYMFYSEEMNLRAMERLHVETGLRRALAQDELVLYFQPKVSMKDGRIVGAEALIRWRHPEQGLVLPGRFIPVAEETGLILEIGAWVLEFACAQIQSWRLAGLRVPPVAVNLSARQFNPGLPQRVKAVLERYAIVPGDLELEITESMLMHGAETVIGMMSELVALGVTLSLDDFGTGFSSLSYLKRFPITTLKIDRSFVVGIPGDANDCAIVSAVVGMAHQLRHKVVAEGVEQADQLRFLHGLGCDQMQGYLFSPPLPALDFERMVRQDARLKG
jgi:EAL domain-containing protein (putative c-di-GMP-specific phosphodiesterase class I)